MSDLYWLTNEQMARLQPYFPKSHGKPRVDDRRVLSGIVFVNRNRLRCCDAPSAYGPHKPVEGDWRRVATRYSLLATTGAQRFSSPPSRSRPPSSFGYDQ